MKKWNYHTAYYFEDKKGNKHNLLTQLYQIGVYIIQDGNASMQGNMTPNQMVSLEKGLKKEEKEGKISNLTFGMPITVIKDEQGFYKKLEL